MRIANTITVDAAKSLVIADERMMGDYVAYASRMGWPLDTSTVHWMYWFTRYILTDWWPAAESSLQQDRYVWAIYSDYKTLCDSVGIIDHTVRVDDRFDVDENNQIVAWKDGYGPKVTYRQQRQHADDIIERIANDVAVFKKNKKLQSLAGDDDEDRELFHD